MGERNSVLTIMSNVPFLSSSMRSARSITRILVSMPSVRLSSSWNAGARTFRSSVAELRQAALEKAALRLLSRERERAFVRRASVAGLAEPSAKIGARRVRERIVGEIAAIQDRVDQRQPGHWPVAHRDRGRAIQLDHG